jgi:hypothetical protein
VARPRNRQSAVRRRPVKVRSSPHLGSRFGTTDPAAQPLSVTKEYLALEGGPPSFSPRFTGADLLRNACGRSCDFVYGTIALFGAWFHTLRLPHDFVTSAGPATARTRRPTTPAAQRVAAYDLPHFSTDPLVVRPVVTVRANA